MKERFNSFLYESRNDILLSCVVFLYETYMHKPFFEYIPSIDALTGDTSGEIIRTKMLNKDNLSSPIEFLDFHTGNTSASYCSGNGWFYDTSEINKMKGFKNFAELKEIDEQFKKEFASTFNLWEDNKYKSNILKYKKDYNGYHPTQKPILLLEDLIKTFSNEGDLVVDLTMTIGGSSVVALLLTAAAMASYFYG